MLEIVDYFAAHQDIFIAAAGPGHWNDPDQVKIPLPHKPNMLFSLFKSALFLLTCFTSKYYMSTVNVMNMYTYKIMYSNLGLNGNETLDLYITSFIHVRSW